MNDWYPADRDSLPQKVEWRETEITKERKARAFQVRILDRRMWDSLSPTHKQAVQEIYDTAKSYLSRMGARTSKMDGGACSTGDMDWATHQEAIYQYMREWKKECDKYRINTQIALDHILFNTTMRQLDSDNRRRSGTSARVFREALDIYCEVRGWNVRQ